MWVLYTNASACCVYVICMWFQCCMYVYCPLYPAGDYDICLDNSFSTFSDKTVYLSIYTYGLDDDDFDEFFDEEEAQEELEEEMEVSVEIMKVSKQVRVGIMKISKWKLKWDQCDAKLYIPLPW